MSIPSSPNRSTGKRSDDELDDILTPTRKVQALLARFDDSNSERDGSKSPNRIVGGLTSQTRPPTTRNARNQLSDESDEDVMPVTVRSRMTARLSGLDRHKSPDHAVSGRAGSSFSEQPINLDRESSPNQSLSERENDSSNALTMKRVLLKKRKHIHAREKSKLSDTSHSASPAREPLSERTAPSTRSGSSTTESDSDNLPENPLQQVNSKFLALVEKHRQQRLEREAAENAKKVAQAESLEARSRRKPRGSSPADDTDENSDASETAAASKLAEEARPTRKASKKAIEDMNRETQRMSRNMQLTHQARTRKKITKESLLARFNFRSSETDAVKSNNVTGASNTVSSAEQSDQDSDQAHSTPPTSPILDTTPQDDVRAGKPAAVETENSMITAVESVPESRDSHDNKPMSLTRMKKGKYRAVDEFPLSAGVLELHHSEQASKDVIVRPVKVKWSRQDILLARAGDSDSDLDIITSKGDTKKYAAFEHLSKRKAGETQSHRALRSLAHLASSSGKNKASMNAAEVDAFLRQTARLQAKQERLQKIEELKAKGVVIQTSEEREREQQEVEDLVERARQEAVDIQKREKERAKKDGTYVKDDLDDDDSDADDEDFHDEAEDEADLGSEEEESLDEDTGTADDEDVEEDAKSDAHGDLIDEEAEEDQSEGETDGAEDEKTSDELSLDEDRKITETNKLLNRPSRKTRIIDDEDEEDDPITHEESSEKTSPSLPAPIKTPLSITRSARKQIPGLQMSDDLPMGLTQAFAATMAESETQATQNHQQPELANLDLEIPSPGISLAPKLNRLDSVDLIVDSQPASQVQSVDIDPSFSQTPKIFQSPVMRAEPHGTQSTFTDMHFEPTQDMGYMLSPFTGNRFAGDTPVRADLNSTADTVIIPRNGEESPLLQRRGRLVQGRVPVPESDEELEQEGPANASAFTLMRNASKKLDQQQFDKSKSHAREIIDEAAEESEDEYAGLGGASDEDANDEENEDDRNMIDEDTQVGKGDEAKLAGLYADRERQQDEAAVSKLLKDITTGALRRKRGANDDLDLSDEEDAAARRREAKRREFAKMRRELLKDEAVGKIAEDKKKQAFLRSIEDREAIEEDELVDIDQSESLQQENSQNTQQEVVGNLPNEQYPKEGALLSTTESQLNKLYGAHRRTNLAASKKPSTLAEIRESVSFLIEEPESQSATIDLGLSDSDDDPEAYVNLDRHYRDVEADENAANEEDEEDLGDFIVDDEETGIEAGGSQEDFNFKKPDIPMEKTTRAPFNERRTNARGKVINRLNLLRQASSSSSTNSNSSKMAFFTSKASNDAISKVPTLLRRATTNSSVGSMGSRRGDETVSATGVVTNRTERGNVSEEKEFVRKGSGGRRNAVNYRPTTVREEKMSARAGVVKQKAQASQKGKKGHTGGFLGALFRNDSWT